MQGKDVAPYRRLAGRLELDAADQDVAEDAAVGRDCDERQLRDEAGPGPDCVDQLGLGWTAEGGAVQLVDLVDVDRQLRSDRPRWSLDKVRGLHGGH